MTPPAGLNTAEAQARLQRVGPNALAPRRRSTALAIASDRVDEEMVERPRRWNIRFIRDFMIIFGLVSSVFDYLTFGLLLFGGFLGFTPLPAWLMLALLGITALYVAAAELAKRFFYARVAL
jgi:Mg2+-importing ATPase